MDFSISNQFPSKHTQNDGNGLSSLDFLTAAIMDVRHHDAQFQSSMNMASGPEGEEASSSLATTEESADRTNKDCSTVESGSTTSNKNKRAKSFPEVLMEILSDPSHASIVGWLPHGKSFAIYDSNKFSTDILPKYFRRVIFRSFIRKLNRWGFRSVKRCVSGFESTFEHKYFIRDQPELCTKMCCKSVPVSKMVSTRSALDIANMALITPSTSGTSVQNALNGSPVPQATPFINGAAFNEEFLVQLRHEFLLQQLRRREMEQNRQQAMMQVLDQMPEGDIVSRLLQLRMLQQRFEP